MEKLKCPFVNYHQLEFASGLGIVGCVSTSPFSSRILLLSLSLYIDPIRLEGLVFLVSYTRLIFSFLGLPEP